MSYLTSSVTRRNLLRFAASLGLTVGFHQLLTPKTRAQNQPIGELKRPDRYPEVIDLEVLESRLKIGDRVADAIAVNGTVPGPIIRLKEGQIATLNVSNRLNTDTSIHWHGIILPAQMDGVPGISFNGIKPGQTFRYRFPVQQSGTYWYHSHSGLQEQQGHFGALIIDPLEAEPFSYDRDYLIMLSDWTDTDPHRILSNLKKSSTYYNNQRRTIGNFGEDLDWAQMRMDPTDIADVTGATYTYLLNGMPPESNWTALFKPGEKVRLRFINASAMTFFDIQIPGLKMTIVQADGQNVQPVTVDEFRIAIAETYDVIVEPERPGPYTIFAETMDRSGYARATLATQPGAIAAIPPRRTRPLRTMADMGMMHDEMREGETGRGGDGEMGRGGDGETGGRGDGEKSSIKQHSGHDAHSKPQTSQPSDSSMPDGHNMSHGSEGHSMPDGHNMSHGSEGHSMPDGHNMNHGSEGHSMPDGHNMNHGSEGHSMPDGHNMNHGSEGHSMPDGHNMNHGSEGHSMPDGHNMNHGSEGEPHGSDTHGAGNAAVPMMVRNRLHEPGIGLENTLEHRVLVYTDLRSLVPRNDNLTVERELELHLTGNMERYMWSFDGKKYSESPIVTLYYGERVRLTFVNDTMMEHPMHLHGMWMEVDNGAGAYKPRKHVLNVKPAEKCSVEVSVDAPGNWAFHCHLLYHMDAGMMRAVRVVDRAAGGAV
ncbi:copper resistance system multicopper oxidase [Oscillatoria sp. FACHB-1406]|uniref:copper resistance system multicopper oxidase n=1 Tax=Oscillatoria sp. FACHB-1406 TaxID=2692846 RepID=UPI0016898EAD|nr:copper resistance system multicopper oxidase [Oscillatoria sp. FACHB-1406]MBD2579177.1 copper resistance system multicopper oxidase [Oscillatoria sp. FACHB-1406]